MKQPTPNTHDRTSRTARLKWVPVAEMRVCPPAQRILNTNRVAKIAAEFDPEQVGTPTVSWRDGHWYVIDGQHRIEAMKRMGWGDQEIQCWTYEGLTEDQEAEMFLLLNDTLVVTAFSRFKVGVTAGREEPNEIDRVVRSQGLVITRQQIPGAIGAVSALERVYRRSDGKTLGRTLRIVRDAYGDQGFKHSEVVEGLGSLCARYNGELRDDETIEKLSNVHGGVNGLMEKAAVLRLQTGEAKAHCIASTAVDIINRGRPNAQKLAKWAKDPIKKKDT